MQNSLIQRLHRIHARCAALPPTFDARGFFTAPQVALLIGRRTRPTWADSTALQLLHWRPSVRRVAGITQRVWFPPAPITTLNKLESHHEH